MQNGCEHLEGSMKPVSEILFGLLVNAIFEILKILALLLFPYTHPLMVHFTLSSLVVLILKLISIRQPKGTTSWSVVFSVVFSVVGFLVVLSLLTAPLKTCAIQERSIIKDRTEHTGTGEMIVVTTMRTIEAINSNSIDWRVRSVEDSQERSGSSKDIKGNYKVADGTVPFLSREVFDTLLSTKDVSVQLIDQDVDEGRFVVLYLREVRTVPMKVNGDTVRLEVVEAITDKGDRIEILNNREYPLILLFDVRERRKVLRRTYELDNFACSYVFEPIGVLTGILN